MLSNEKTVTWLIKNRSDKYGILDLCFMDFGDLHVRLGGIKAKRISNGNQEADYIFNGQQKATTIINSNQEATTINNVYQKADAIINSDQKAEEIYNNFQKAEKIINNDFQKIKEKTYEEMTKEELIKLVKELQK